MRDKITIVALIGELGRGGSERQLYLTMTHLDPNRFDRHVVVFNTSRHAVYDELLQVAGVAIWHMPKSYHTIAHRLRFLIRLLHRLRVDIVHSWTTHDNPYAGIAGIVARVPVRWGSVRISLSAPGYGDLPSLYRLLCLYAVQKLVVNSRSLEKELTQKGLREDRIVRLENAVQIHAENQVPADLSEYGIAADAQVIGVIANIRYRKNQLLFVEAMGRIRQHFPEVRAVLVGQVLPDEEEYASIVRRRISSLGLAEHVVWLGFREDISSILQRLDVFCLPSRHEGTPNALLEAMAAGCVVVATNVDGVPDVIEHGENGLLVPSEDSTAMSDALIRLLSAPQWAEKLRLAAKRSVAKQHDCRVVGKRLSELYARELI